MINFAALKKGDKLVHFGEQKTLVVESVDVDRGWWMVTFENDGRNIKSVDPSFILNDFDLLCPKCEQPIESDECETCKRDEMVAKVNLLVGQTVVVHSSWPFAVKVRGTLLKCDTESTEWCVTTSIPSFQALGTVSFNRAVLSNVEGISIFLS